MLEVTPRSKKGAEWKEFAEIVLTHVDNYTVSQYGDTGNDGMDEYTQEDCIKAIKRYCARFGRNSRPGQDKLDMLKIAHYACFTYNKIKEKEDDKRSK